MPNSQITPHQSLSRWMDRAKTNLQMQQLIRPQPQPSRGSPKKHRHLRTAARRGALTGVLSVAGRPAAASTARHREDSLCSCF